MDWLCGFIAVKRPLVRWSGCGNLALTEDVLNVLVMSFSDIRGVRHADDWIPAPSPVLADGTGHGRGL